MTLSLSYSLLGCVMVSGEKKGFAIKTNGCLMVGWVKCELFSVKMKVIYSKSFLHQDQSGILGTYLPKFYSVFAQKYYYHFYVKGLSLRLVYTMDWFICFYLMSSINSITTWVSLLHKSREPTGCWGSLYQDLWIILCLFQAK